MKMRKESKRYSVRVIINIIYKKIRTTSSLLAQQLFPSQFYWTKTLYSPFQERSAIISKWKPAL